MEEDGCSDEVHRNKLNNTQKTGTVLSIFSEGYAFFHFVREVTEV